LAAIWRGEADRERARPLRAAAPHIAVEHTQLQNDPQQEAAAGEGPCRAAEESRRAAPRASDPKLAREFLLRSSLINSVREAARIE
jgi:hypothetical protein